MNPFTLASINFAWLSILPLIAIVVGAMTIMLARVYVDDEDSSGLGVLALLTLLVAFVLAALNFGQNILTFGGSLALDDYSAFFELLIIVAACSPIGARNLLVS